MISLYKDIEFIEEQKPCSYFNDKLSDIRYKYMNNCSKVELQNMLEHGWRRFGHMHFVPECRSCTKCISIRIDINKYIFSKSNKRLLSKHKNTKIVIQPPSISIQHLKLYDKYHSFMNNKKKWPYNKIDPEEYIRSYVKGGTKFAKEILYFIDNRLVCVALCDILDNALSSIYCFYDHDYQNYSLGQYSILYQLKLAKELNIRYIYLGYWIKDHFSMGYKEKYQPFEILVNRSNLDKIALWKEYNPLSDILY
jgi:leucyl-tRNA---protein transferase